MKDISLLQALEYEKVTFDDEPINLYSESLPVTLFMGRLSNNSHKTFVPQFSLDGQNLLLYSKDKGNLYQLIENAYISSWLNGKARVIYYHCDENKIFHLTGFPYATLKKDTIISQFENLYEECKENERLSDSDKSLHIVMISDLAEMPFFARILFEYKFEDKRDNYINTIDNPFDFFDIENNSFQEQLDAHITVSVGKKIKDMLINGKKYGVVFIIGDSNFESFLKLKQYPFYSIELDNVDTLNIVTKKKEIDKVMAWSSDAPQEVDLFLSTESPFYEAFKAYCNLDL